MPDTNVPVQTTPAAPTQMSPWVSLRDEVNDLFDRFTGGFGFPFGRRAFDALPRVVKAASFPFTMPAIDLCEDAKGYSVTAELPGLSEKDIEVSISGDMLTLKGEKRQEEDKTEKNYHITERSYGTFRRMFYLPDGVDRDKIAASFAKGVLTITLPKSAQAAAQDKKIEVKAAA